MEIDTHILDELDKFCSQRNLILIGDCKTLKHGEPIDKFYVLIRVYTKTQKPKIQYTVLDWQ